jgi:Ca-activated chloride channel family protein
LLVVSFDDQIDVLQSATQVTPAVQRQLRSAIGSLEARASTALHEGWLTGCKALSDSLSDPVVARCLLLTDGLANVGVTVPEQIAFEAAGVRSHTGIGTSTFGIGPDYDEGLLGPMAVAGGGQFHHLRAAAEIGQTFAGELGELFAVAASRVRLELVLSPGVRPEMVSQYSLRSIDDGAWVAEIGDLIGGEERHVVIRFLFPPGTLHDGCTVRARLHWSAEGRESTTDWSECRFTYAINDECDQEIARADRAVLHWVGLHHADQARLEAAALNQQGKFEEARKRVAVVADHLGQYAGTDPDLQAALANLRALELQVAEAPMLSMVAKDMAYESLRSSRGQRDLRRH